MEGAQHEADLGLQRPVGTFESILNQQVPVSMRLGWVATFLALALITALVPGIENRWYSAGLLVALAPAQYWWHVVMPNGRMVESRALHDGSVSLIIASLSPAVWHPIMLVYAMGVGNLGRHETPRWVGALLVFNGLALAAIGAIHGRAAWLSTSITVAILLLLRRVIVDAMWDRVRDAEGQLFDVLDSVWAALYIADGESGEITWVSDSIERITGWTPTEWRAQHAELNHAWIDLDRLEAGGEYHEYVQLRHASGQMLWVSVSTRVVERDDGTLSLRGHYTDATTLVDAQSEVTALAQMDHLTGLANRHVLLRNVAERLDGGDQCALLIIDIDRFKEINDTLGHSFGDEVLRAVGARIRNAAPGQLVCRLGGDEFAVLIVEPGNTALIAHGIANACAEVMRIGEMTMATQVSIGSVVSPNDGSTTEELMRHADIAMYVAKARHEPHVEFDSSMEQTSAFGLKLSGNLADGLERDEFEVFFQPQVDLETTETVGVEGLVRWRHPDHGLLYPGSFIQLVALSNIRRAFTDRVLGQAIEFAATTAAQGSTIPVSVNISMASLFDAGFPGRVEAMLDLHAIDPARLKLEITEDDIMEEYTSASPVLASLHAMGVGLSIDDFGTGHSSMSRLVDLPVTEIKIDTRFVAAMIDQRRERAVVESILGLAHRLRLSVVAEGIENEAQAALLLELGCTVGQGFLYSPAVRPKDVLSSLGNSPAMRDNP